ncbi:SRPBCC family protein [Pontibacter beigongshangensis]|uniref:SRPBCC family protein n=1 Tax=Pontibacter beigongshangensis TaxID=2574733 RepID=UPI0016502053|nr:SRPBCC family protein [Pontibacter beigongshangensis]
MPLITQQFIVNAPIEICFDLSRSIELHVISTRHTGERAIAGVTTGLIGLHETVTWRARHFGIWQTLTSKITAYNRPYYFADEMVSGIFKSFRHQHLFEQVAGGTRMTDIFDFTSPLGLLGSLADKLLLEHYMTRLLRKRNQVIKEYAETGKWHEVF